MSPKLARNLPVPSSAPSDAPSQPRPTLSNKEKVVLFQTWEKADNYAKQAQRALDEANASKVEACKSIADALGAGAYAWKGHTRILTSRTNKETGKSTWFFREPMTQEAEVIG